MLQRNWQVNKQKVAGKHFGTHNAKINLGEFKTYRDVKEKKYRGKQEVAFLTSRMDDRTSITKRKTGSCGGLWSWEEWEKNTERVRERHFTAASDFVILYFVSIYAVFQIKSVQLIFYQKPNLFIHFKCLESLELKNYWKKFSWTFLFVFRLISKCFLWINKEMRFRSLLHNKVFEVLQILGENALRLSTKTKDFSAIKILSDDTEQTLWSNIIYVLALYPSK